MSNPGVKYLAMFKNKKHIMSIEDNIGESVHIHYDDIRIDITIKEFIYLVDNLNDILNNLIDVESFDVKEYDSFFIYSMSRYLINLERVERTNIKISDIKVLTKNTIGMPVFKNVKYSRVIKFLNGNKKENNNYKQQNLIGQTNSGRVKNVYEYVTKKKKLSMQDPAIVFFNDKDQIKDGQHRVSCFLHCYGDDEIPIVRLHFKNNLYNFTWKSYCHALLRNFMSSIIDILKRVKIIRYVRYLIKKIK